MADSRRSFHFSRTITIIIVHPAVDGLFITQYNAIDWKQITYKPERRSVEHIPPPRTLIPNKITLNLTPTLNLTLTQRDPDYHKNTTVV